MKISQNFLGGVVLFWLKLYLMNMCSVTYSPERERTRSTEGIPGIPHHSTRRDFREGKIIPADVYAKFTALHGMLARTSDEKGVCLFVRPIPSYYSEIIPNLLPPIPSLTTHSHFPFSRHLYSHSLPLPFPLPEITICWILGRQEVCIII